MNAKDEDAACVYLSNAKPYPEMSAGSHDQQRAIVVRAFSWSVPRPFIVTHSQTNFKVTKMKMAGPTALLLATLLLALPHHEECATPPAPPAPPSFTAYASVGAMTVGDPRALAVLLARPVPVNLRLSWPDDGDVPPEGPLGASNGRNTAEGAASGAQACLSMNRGKALGCITLDGAYHRRRVEEIESGSGSDSDSPRDSTASSSSPASRRQTWHHLEYPALFTLGGAGLRDGDHLIQLDVHLSEGNGHDSGSSSGNDEGEGSKSTPTAVAAAAAESPAATASTTFRLQSPRIMIVEPALDGTVIASRHLRIRLSILAFDPRVDDGAELCVAITGLRTTCYGSDIMLAAASYGAAQTATAPLTREEVPANGTRREEQGRVGKRSEVKRRDTKG